MAQAQPDLKAGTNLKGSTRLGGYLRKLRTGYGYSLRRVEERARAEGGEIDNSQLSRYEKGICYPSFDKLRILASVFNVSIQSFSDVVDLEVFEGLKPAAGDAEALLEHGNESMKDGDHGQAFAYFERAIERLLEQPMSADRQALLGKLRVYQAGALTRLGKLSLAEQELRAALRIAEQLNSEIRARALLALANIHADQGDHFIGEIEAEKALRLARENSLVRMEAMALHTMGRVLFDRGRFGRAIERYREASGLYVRCGEDFEAIRVRINVGACYVELGKHREGIRLVRAALNEARSGNHRRLQAFGWSSLGQAYFHQKDHKRARACFRESDALAVYNEEKQPDILFLNAYYEWKMAAEAGNPTRERIAFGRLKALRSCLERRFVEVDAFDDHMEGGRHHA